MRLIDADKFEVVAFENKSDEFIEGAQAVLEMIDAAPTIEAEPVKHGEWVSRFARHWKGRDQCSECGFHEKDHRDLSHYNCCPNCSAKMDVTDTNVGDKENSNG